MKRGGAVGVAFIAVMFVSSEVSAGSIKVISGGPKAKSAQLRVVVALTGAGPMLSRCFRRGKRTVKVALVVSPSGKIVRSRAQTRGPVARCVAGALGVQRLPRLRKRYAMVVELSPGDDASPTRRDMSTVNQDLAPVRRQMNACARSYKVTGRIRVVFFITAEGSLLDLKVTELTGAKAAARICMLAVLRRAKVRAQPGARAVTYRLGLSFDNRGNGRNNARPPKRDKSLQPKKFGPLPTNAIGPVMRAKLPKFERCYTRVAKRRPRLAGDIVLRFSVRSNGTVRNVKIRKTTMKHKGVERCIVAVGKTLKFPGEKGRATTRVFYPFRFAKR